MPSCSVTVTVDALPDRTFSILTDVESWPDVFSAITGVEKLTEGPVCNGTRFKETRVLFGKQATEEMAFANLDPPRSFVLLAQSHGTEYRTTHTLTQEGDATRVDVHFKATPVSLPAKLLSPLAGLMLRACRNAMNKDLAELREHLESPREAAV